MAGSDEVLHTFRLQSLAIPDAEGQLLHCRTVLSDITERRIAYDALEKLNIDLHESLTDSTAELDRSIEKLRLLSEAVEHLGEGVIITSGDLDWPGPKIVFVNPAMCQIAGYEADELIGKSPRILQGPETDPKSLKALRESLLTDGSCVAELVNYRKDGSPYDVELFITPLFDANGKRTHFVSIQRNITQRMQSPKRFAESTS